MRKPIDRQLKICANCQKWESLYKHTEKDLQEFQSTTGICELNNTKKDAEDTCEHQTMVSLT